MNENCYELTVEEEVDMLVHDVLVKASSESDPADVSKTLDIFFKLMDEKRKMEDFEKMKKLEKRKKIFEWIELAIKIFGVFGPLCLYYYLFKAGLQFETSGTVTSTFFRNLIGKLKPTA